MWGLIEIAADYMGTLFSDYGMINAINAQSNIFARLWEWLTKLSHKYSENGLDRQKRVDLLAKKLKSIVDRVYGSQEKLTKKKAEIEAKKKADAEAEKEVKAARKAEAKATRKEEAEAARDAQKSTETNEKVEDEQNTADAEKRAETAENDAKMSVAGEISETADLSALDKAKAMLEENPNADTVTETGWWQGKDGKWRYEIADNDMRFERDGLYRNPQTLEDYIEHDKLFEAYPHLKNIRVEFVDAIGSEHDINGRYINSENRILLKNGRTDAETKKTLIHEIQHAVQNYEGFVGGSNTKLANLALFNFVYSKVKNSPEYKRLKTPEERFNYIDTYADPAGEDIQKQMAKSYYEHNYGEEEAQATASRIGMSEAQRKANPIINNGIVYSGESVRSDFIDSLREMGYNETEINDKISEDLTSVREIKEIVGRESGGVHGALDFRPRGNESIYKGIDAGTNRGKLGRGSQNVSEVYGTTEESGLGEAGGENNARRLLRLRGLKYSVAGEITEETDPTYAELERELKELKKRNAKLAKELTRTYGKEADPKAAKAILNEIIEKYQGTIKAKDIQEKL